MSKAKVFIMDVLRFSTPTIVATVVSVIIIPIISRVYPPAD